MPGDVNAVDGGGIPVPGDAVFPEKIEPEPAAIPVEFPWQGLPLPATDHEVAERCPT
jgi:hypothetical protein